MTGRRMNGSERFMTWRRARVGAAWPAGATGCCDADLAAGRDAHLAAVTTTRSPALSPLPTTMRSPCRCPSVTGRSSAVQSSLTT